MSSDFVIEDGTGDAHKAEVNENHQLSVRAEAAAEIRTISERDGTAYVTSTPEIAVPTSEYYVSYFKNDGNDPIHLERVWISWDGGSTSFNRPLEFSFYGNTPAIPTANTVDSIALPMSFLSSTPAQIEGYNWDGVGTGLTLASPGIKMGAMFCAQGVTVLDLHGAILLGRNAAITIGMKCTEAGRAFLSTTFFTSPGV